MQVWRNIIVGCNEKEKKRQKNPIRVHSPSNEKVPKVREEPGNYKNVFASSQVNLRDYEWEHGFENIVNRFKLIFDGELLAKLGGEVSDELYTFLEKTNNKEYKDIPTFIRDLEKNTKDSYPCSFL